MKAPIVILGIMIAILGSCTATRYQLINADMSLISLGMQKEEVVKRIGKPNLVVASQRSAEGNIEVYEYLRLEFDRYTEKRVDRPIWVYFVDDEVVEWGPGENWQMDNTITQRLLEKYRHRSRR